MITKIELDKLVEKYETTDFIKDDPIQFCHRFVKKEEIELAGFIASLFAYGNRKIFIKKLDEIFSKAEGELLEFVKNGDFSSLKGVEYRFYLAPNGNSIKIVKENEEHKIDNSNYEEFKSIINSIFSFGGSKNSQPDFNPSGDLAKKIA